MNAGPIVTINSRKFDHSLYRSWKAGLIDRDADLLVFEGVFEIDVDHPNLGFIRSGTRSVEYYWLEKWYNIFRFHEPDGAVRNYYCNIIMPPVFSGSTLDYVDLDIDVVVWPGDNYEVLDLAEYEENALLLSYPESVRSRASSALDEVVALIESGGLPQ